MTAVTQLTRGQKRRLMYVENKDGTIDGADARIGWVTFSKTGSTVYYRGKELAKAQGIRGNFLDVATREEYWVSGVKKRGSNVHRAERATVVVDSDAADAYRELKAVWRMEFGLSDDQKMMQESIERTLERVAPLERVRKAAGREPFAADVLKALVELGVPGILIAEDFGGLGLSLLDAVLAAEALGRHVAPVPFIASSVMAPLALAGAGSDKQKKSYLPKLTAGESIAGVAISEQAAGARENAGITAKGGKLSGKTLFVLDFAGADVFIVADKFAGLHIVDAKAKGLEKIQLTTIDATRSLGELDFDNVEAEPLLSGNPAATLDRMIDAGRIMLAADTLGAGGRMIEKAVAYAKERQQFGRVIGSFQAVKHLCAEMVAELEPCRALIWYAAYAFDEFPDQSRRMAAHAKAHTSEVGTFVARTATEVHGGMGFTDLLGLHYWFKRIGFDRQALGGPEKVRHDAAVAQGWVGN